MSISVVADNISSSTSVSIPAHQIGDLIVISARGTSAVPSIPAASGNVPAWIPIQGAVANSVALRTVAFVATSSTHTSGIFTGATHMVCTVFRSTVGGVLSIGGSSTGNANNTQTIVYPALTLTKTNGTSMGFRIGTRGTAIAAVSTPPTNWGLRGAPGVPPPMASFNRASLVANPTADSVALTGASNSAYRAHTVEIVEAPPPVPLDETMIDDFNRADAKITIGRPDLWAPYPAEPHSIYDLDVINNELTGTVYSPIMRSKFMFDANFDLLIDVKVASTLTGINNIFRLLSCLNLQGSGQNGIDFRWKADGGIDIWRVTNGSNSNNITGSVTPPVAGQTIWISRRGSVFTLYKGPTGGPYPQVFTWSDSTYMRPGYILIYGPSENSYRYDNLRGGPLVAPPTPLNETLIDDFNRADARVDVGAGATIWKSAWYDGGVDTDMRVISNQLGLLAAQYTPAFTLRSVQNSCDVVIDCIAPPAAPNNEFGLYFCMSDVPSGAFDGYAIFWSAGTWILRRYLNGANAGNIITATATLVAGDSIWVSKVGSALKLYKKPSGGNYGLILQATDANHNLPGKIIVELSDTAQRWENLRGGPFVLPSRSVMVI